MKSDEIVIEYTLELGGKKGKKETITKQNLPYNNFKNQTLRKTINERYRVPNEDRRDTPNGQTKPRIKGHKYQVQRGILTHVTYNDRSSPIVSTN